MISLVRSQAPKASAGLLFRKRCVALFSGAKLQNMPFTCKHTLIYFVFGKIISVKYLICDKMSYFCRTNTKKQYKWKRTTTKKNKFLYA